MTTPSARRSTGARRTGAAERLVAATRSLVVQEGLDGLTSRSIAAEAGENLGAITYHFGSKDELVAVALVGSCRDLLEPVLEVLRAERPPADKLAETVAALAELFTTSPGERAAYVEALSGARRSDAVGDALRSMWHEVRGLLSDVVEAQRLDGMVPSWTDPGALADLFLSVANGILVTAAIDTEHIDPPAVASQLAILLLSAGRSGEHRGDAPGTADD